MASVLEKKYCSHELEVLAFIEALKTLDIKLLSPKIVRWNFFFYKNLTWVFSDFYELILNSLIFPSFSDFPRVYEPWWMFICNQFVSAVIYYTHTHTHTHIHI